MLVCQNRLQLRWKVLPRGQPVTPGGAAAKDGDAFLTRLLPTGSLAAIAPEIYAVPLMQVIIGAEKNRQANDGRYRGGGELVNCAF